MAENIDLKISTIEKSLTTDAAYSGRLAKLELGALVDGECDELERTSVFLEHSFRDIDQEMHEFSIRVARNAAAARTRLKSLLAFFRDDFGQNVTSELFLRDQAEQAARDTSKNSNVFKSLFRFNGAARIIGNASLIQTLFQNIYQNTIKYGSNTLGLCCDTIISSGTFSEMSSPSFPYIERPIIDGPWTRIEISNNGPRLSVQDPRAIFKLGRKFPVQGVTAEDSQGLGMAICFVVVTIHRGAIQAESTNGGVKITILLPHQPRIGFNEAQLLGIAKRLDII